MLGSVPMFKLLFSIISNGILFSINAVANPIAKSDAELKTGF